MVTRSHIQKICIFVCKFNNLERGMPKFNTVSIVLKLSTEAFRKLIYTIGMQGMCESSST
jgi:hypothetical protein